MATGRTRNQLLHGSDADPPRRVELRAGPLDVSLVGVDLRYLRHGGEEMVRRIYATVRDRNWNTVAGEVSGLELERDADRFLATFEVHHADAEVDFRWRGRIEGHADGGLSYSLDGEAGRDMHYNRVGFCVLHPIAEIAGAAYRGVTPEGPVEGRFPLEIGVQGFVDGHYVPLHPAVEELRTQLPSGAWVRLDFEGDLFETEDQRNWTDASFKTYCTPLALGFPHLLRAGETLSQRVTIGLEGPAAAAASRPARGATHEVGLEVGEPGRPLPALGLGHGPTADERSIALLLELRPTHLRVDLDLAGDWERTLAPAAAEAAALGTPIELALHLRAGDDERLDRLRTQLEPLDVVRVLAIPAEGETATPTESTPSAILAAARIGLPGLPIFGGTDMNFCELNRTRPDPAACDGVFYPIVSQVHAFDDLSLVETPAAQGDTVRAASALAAGKPIAVSPVTLHRRFNPNATGPEAAPVEGELPDSVDPRQASLLGAAWTVASIAALAAAGAGSVTYYESMGWRGTLEADVIRPWAFPSRPGEAFPVWHVFAALAGGGSLLPTRVEDPLAVAALGWRNDAGSHLLVANLGCEERTVSARGVGARPSSLRLNEGTHARAAAEPLGFRREGWAASSGPLTLNAFETVELAW